MKTPSDTLFILIQSLDNTEKTYLKKVFNSSQSDTILAKIYSHFLSLNQYNEKKVISDLKIENSSNFKHYKQ